MKGSKKKLKKIPIWLPFIKGRQYILCFDPGKNVTGMGVLSHYKGYDLRIELLYCLQSTLKSLSLNNSGEFTKEKKAFERELIVALEDFAALIDIVVIERYQGRRAGSGNEYVNATIFSLHSILERLIPKADIHLITPASWKGVMKSIYEMDKAEGELLFPSLYYNPGKREIKKNKENGIRKEIIPEHPLDAIGMGIYTINNQWKATHPPKKKPWEPVRIIYKEKYHRIAGF